MSTVLNLVMGLTVFKNDFSDVGSCVYGGSCVSLHNTPFLIGICKGGKYRSFVIMICVWSSSLQQLYMTYNNKYVRTSGCSTSPLLTLKQRIASFLNPMKGTYIQMLQATQIRSGSRSHIFTTQVDMSPRRQVSLQGCNLSNICNAQNDLHHI